MYCSSKCCRLCLTNNNTLVNIKLFGSDGVSFLDKLGLLAPTLVANPRNYTSKICEQCRNKLEEAYSFIQHCFKSDAVFHTYCKQLTNADTAQNKCIDSDVSDIYLTGNMIKESIPILVKEECLEDLPAIDDNQYYLESIITIEKHELSPVNIEIKLESSELKQEACFNVADDSTSNDEIIVLEYDRDQPENVHQIDPIAGTSEENYISFSPNDFDIRNDHAYSCNMNSPNSLTKHRSIRSRKPRKKGCFKCAICKKTFTYFGNLKQHERLHSGERPFKCKMCNKTFTQSCHLKQHERLHSSECPYKCKTCNKTFSQSNHLKVHERFHSGEHPYKCQICNKTFSYIGNLKQHEKVHSGERPYECQICNMKFALSNTLKHHELVHTGQRPFKCKICDKTFTRAAILKDHERLHTGERPFKCNICNETFIRSALLKYHKLMHTGERPFTCKICDKTFSQMRTLKYHERLHCGERMSIV